MGSETWNYGAGIYLPFVKKKPKELRVWYMGSLIGYHLLPDPTPEQLQESRAWFAATLDRIITGPPFIKIPEALQLTMEDLLGK